MAVKLHRIKIDGQEQYSDKWLAVADYEKHNDAYAVVSNQYLPIEHGTVITAIDNVLAEIDELKKYTVQDKNADAFLVKNGARMYKQYIFPDTEVRMADGAIRMGILVTNSHDTSTTLKVQLRAYRLACANDLPTGFVFSGMVKKHTKNLSIDTEELKNGLKLSIGNFRKIKDKWMSWHKERIETNKIPKIIASVFDAKKHQEEAIKLYSKVEDRATVSKWLLFNLLTNVNTHSVPFETARSTDKKILRLIEGVS